MSDNFFSFDEIQADSIKRIKSGFPHLDYIYGNTKVGDKDYRFGLPRGKVSIWVGPSGIGKTRICIGISAKVNEQGLKTLMFQNEVSLPEFKSWVKVDIPYPQNYYLSSKVSLEDQIKVLREIKPDVAIVDSINMIKGFNSPTVLRNIMEEYKKAVMEVGCHVIFIGHMNKEGETKGNNDIEYLADILCRLFPHKGVVSGVDYPGHFYLEVLKNRYGKNGGWCCFAHNDKTIEYIHSSYQSYLDDKSGKYDHLKQPQQEEYPKLYGPDAGIDWIMRKLFG